ncbi:hypothetical protein B0H12DRAFT_1010092 [Mycena haematopus]|nr:hypothetical protein B0H12DRAFT_1010092 [Mycena haematopus]
MRASPVHAASLVDPASHPPQLLQLVCVKLNKYLIEYVVDCVSETVAYAMHPADPARAPSPSPYRAPFTTFATTVLSRAEVSPATLLVALVYVFRARPHLSIALEQYALERVFLGALIVASKYTNDSTLKNIHWALCTGLFGKRDIGRIEREFLDVLDWELGVSEADLMAHHEGVVAAAERESASARTRVKSPVPHAKTHVRRPSMPELEPSSPQSSLASMSPRTPSSGSYPSSSSSPDYAHAPHHASSYSTHASSYASHRPSSYSSHRPSHSYSHSHPHSPPHAMHIEHADAMDVDMDLSSPPPSRAHARPTRPSHSKQPNSKPKPSMHDLLRAFPRPRPRGYGYAIRVEG